MLVIAQLQWMRRQVSGCDDMNRVYVNVIAWCDIIKSGCDVICIHMMSCILCLCYHTHTGGYMIDNLGVNTEMQIGRAHV